jgi:hypothetical protein
MMRKFTRALAGSAFVLFASSALAQVDPNPAMNNPDKLAWQLFIQVNSRGQGANSIFETFASDGDTFQLTPQYPAGPTTPSLRPPILPHVAREMALRNGVPAPTLMPDPRLSLEETRRNRASFDFIVNNNLFKRSGLKAAFGKDIAFPVDAIEVKANWVPVEFIPDFTKNQVTLAQVPQLYHVNTDRQGNRYALVAMHVITKQVPNWTWATFEHRFNPARCDITGCRDSFGAQTSVVSPSQTSDAGYPDCTKSSALNALFAAADIEPVYVNYCLRGTQVDFIDTAGLDIRLGNSVAEAGFVATSSCMTCHGRAAFDANGRAVPPFLAPFVGALGPLLPSWYFSFTNQPPIVQGMPGLVRTATPADFVWSIPVCAIDDTQTPPRLSRDCLGK